MKRIITALLMTAALAGPMLAVPTMSSAQVFVGVSVGYAPPPLPGYPQPFCPGAGYIWTPGYWAWGPYGYFWVPGTWVLAPAVDLFWTPGYWAWNGGFWWWNPGYWGPTVGFYGGINYGYGYTGYGYVGGYWRQGAFYYNRAVTNVDVTYIHNTYNQTVINNTNVSRISYNGGTDGIHIRPTAEQLSYAREQHVVPTAMQLHQERLAFDNPAQRFTVNRGRPEIAATTRPGNFSGPGVVHMNTERNAYVYRQNGRNAVTEHSGFQNAYREDVRPWQPQGNPYVNDRPMQNNYAAPRRMPEPRPAPPKDSDHHPQPPTMNPYAEIYRPEVRSDQNDWNTSRADQPTHARQFVRPSYRQVAWSAPRVEERAPAENSGRSHRNNRPPR